jgi:GGDEF domain-containing protein
MEGLFSKKLKIYIDGFVDDVSDVIGNKVSDEVTKTEIQNWVKAEGEHLWKNVELLMKDENSLFGSYEDFIDAADNCLYRSKKSGRNCTICSSEAET